MLSKTDGYDNELGEAARICDLYTVSIGVTRGDVQRRDWRFHRIQRNIQENIREEMNYDGTPQYIPNPLRSYQVFTQADMNKMKRELKFEPSYDIRRGVRKILEQLR